MTDEEYALIKKRFTPKHLTPEGRKQVNVFVERENANKLADMGRASDLDRLIDRAYMKCGVGSDTLNATIYAVAFFKRFGFWPQPGADMRTVDNASLTKLHEVCARIIYRPEIIGSDERTMTIFDFSGLDAKGERERFSSFVNRLVDNRYRSLKKKAVRERKSEVGIQANTDEPLEDGFINEFQLMRASAVPVEGVLYNNQIPGLLAAQIKMLNQEFQRTHPAIAHAILNLNITSSAEIARLISTGALNFWIEMEPNQKASKDKERISSIWKEYKYQFRAIIERYVRECQARIIEESPSFVPQKDLDDPEALNREMMRVTGMVKRTKNPVGFKTAKRTPAQKLGFNTFLVGAGRFSEE